MLSFSFPKVQYAIKLRESKNKQESNKIIMELKNILESNFPSFIAFKTKFVTLTYSKNDSPLNMKTKYTINKLHCYYADKDIFDVDGSVEHIIPETEGVSLNIGNLILLEGDLNSEASNDEYELKKSVYKKSSYKWVQEFITTYNSWQDELVYERAEMLAKIYYEKIFKRKIEE